MASVNTPIEFTLTKAGDALITKESLTMPQGIFLKTRAPTSTSTYNATVGVQSEGYGEELSYFLEFAYTQGYGGTVNIYCPLKADSYPLFVSSTSYVASDVFTMYIDPKKFIVTQNGATIYEKYLSYYAGNYHYYSELRQGSDIMFTDVLFTPAAHPGVDGLTYTTLTTITPNDPTSTDNRVLTPTSFRTPGLGYYADTTVATFGARTVEYLDSNTLGLQLQFSMPKLANGNDVDGINIGIRQVIPNLPGSYGFAYYFQFGVAPVTIPPDAPAVFGDHKYLPAATITGFAPVTDAYTYQTEGEYESTDIFSIQTDGYNVFYIHNGIVVANSHLQTGGGVFEFFCDVYSDQNGPYDITNIRYFSTGKRGLPGASQSTLKIIQGFSPIIVDPETFILVEGAAEGGDTVATEEYWDLSACGVVLECVTPLLRYDNTTPLIFDSYTVSFERSDGLPAVRVTMDAFKDSVVGVFSVNDDTGTRYEEFSTKHTNPTSLRIYLDGTNANITLGGTETIKFPLDNFLGFADKKVRATVSSSNHLPPLDDISTQPPFTKFRVYATGKMGESGSLSTLIAEQHGGEGTPIIIDRQTAILLNQDDSVRTNEAFDLSVCGLVVQCTTPQVINNASHDSYSIDVGGCGTIDINATEDGLGSYNCYGGDLSGGLSFAQTSLYSQSLTMFFDGTHAHITLGGETKSFSYENYLANHPGLKNPTIYCNTHSEFSGSKLTQPAFTNFRAYTTGKAGALGPSLAKLTAGANSRIIDSQTFQLLPGLHSTVTTAAEYNVQRGGAYFTCIVPIIYGADETFTITFLPADFNGGNLTGAFLLQLTFYYDGEGVMYVEGSGYQYNSSLSVGNITAPNFNKLDVLLDGSDAYVSINENTHVINYSGDYTADYIDAAVHVNISTPGTLTNSYTFNSVLYSPTGKKGDRGLLGPNVSTMFLNGGSGKIVDSQTFIIGGSFWESALKSGNLVGEVITLESLQLSTGGAYFQCRLPAITDYQAQYGSQALEIRFMIGWAWSSSIFTIRLTKESTPPYGDLNSYVTLFDSSNVEISGSKIRYYEGNLLTVYFDGSEARVYVDNQSSLPAVSYSAFLASGSSNSPVRPQIRFLDFSYNPSVNEGYTFEYFKFFRTGKTGPSGPQGPTGPSGPVGQGYSTLVTNPATVLGPGQIGYSLSGTFSAIPTMQMGKVARVDSVYGNDSTAYIGGLPYATIAAAITAIGSTTGITIWVLPGTYELSSGITLPTGTAMRGVNVQTCTIQKTGATGDTVLLTMGESCRVEDLTLKLTSSGHYSLTGLQFEGTTSQTSKLRTCVLTVDNSAASNSGTSFVYGVVAKGTGSLTSSSFSFNCIKGSTINVYSNGNGNKRGILVGGSNVVTTRDTNVYVAQPAGPTGPTGPSGPGSYVGIETNDTLGPNLGSIQLRSTTIGTVTPTAGQTYTSSDILQTTPATISNPTYLASAGIQIGPGTDLVTKTAGSKGFSTYNYPTTLYYCARGTLNTSGVTTTGGYLFPGTVACAGGGNAYPDASALTGYRVQQPFILSGIVINCNVAPGGANTTTVIVRRTPAGGSIADVANYTIALTGTATSNSYYSATQTFGAGDTIHVKVTYNAAGNATQDLSVQLDCF